MLYSSIEPRFIAPTEAMQHLGTDEQDQEKRQARQDRIRAHLLHDAQKLLTAVIHASVGEGALSPDQLTTRVACRDLSHGLLVAVALNQAGYISLTSTYELVATEQSVECSGIIDGPSLLGSMQLPPE